MIRSMEGHSARVGVVAWNKNGILSSGIFLLTHRLKGLLDFKQRFKNEHR